MIVACNLPKLLWPEMVNHRAYICNCSCTRALLGNMPEGAWMKKCSNVTHLQEFRVPVWILHEQQNISKLEPKSVKQIFVEFDDGPKAIKYYDMATHHVKMSCNYTFYSANPSIQFEGKKQSEPIGMESLTKKRIHPDKDGGHLSPRWSTRPMVEHNYASLQNPF